MATPLAATDVEATVRAASRSLARLLDRDETAGAVLSDLDVRRPVDDSSVDGLTAWKQHEFLRIAARDLTGVDAFETVAAALAAMASDVLAAAVTMSGVTMSSGQDVRIAVIGMGKLGAAELNYSSDVDVMLVGEGEPRALSRSARGVVDIARRCFRIDLNLRPEGRNGALSRTLESYEVYWEKWAEPWEFQALLKARCTGGDAELGAQFEASAAQHLWSRPFTAEDLRSLRAMKARAEAEVARKGLSEREIKLGPGGIRDVEFAVQLLQLVHGGADEELRVRATLTALDELADAGYVARHDADQLGPAYRFLRTVEHRLQLDDEQQVHALPSDPIELDRLARVLGYVGSPASSAAERLLDAVRAQQGAVRAIHERLWFRPLLEDFAGGEPVLSPEAAAARLAAFGFADVTRTRQAVTELTRGLTRSSRLMQQLLPLLLDWLSTSPDPDLGLLGLRTLASGPQRSMELATTFRESPMTAQRLCRLLGTSRMLGDILRHNPELIDDLGAPDGIALRTADELHTGAAQAMEWRADTEHQWHALKRYTDREGLRIAARDVLDGVEPREVGFALTNLADAALEAALSAIEPQLPVAVIALGRLGGQELSYASDLDLLVVYDGGTTEDFAAAERVAAQLLRSVGGNRPHIYDIDLDLRPEGKDGPLARSLDGFRMYFERWAQPWERLAMARARFAAGDASLARGFLAVLAPFVWEQPVSNDDRKEIRRVKARVERERIPAGDDPQFHLKLGPGSLSDVEFCVQLLQLEHGVRNPNTVAALDQLRDDGHIGDDDHAILTESYRFCERTRNRWFLVDSSPSDSLPARDAGLEKLATSLGTNAHQFREDYRRVTRRCRRVVERLFYGRGA